MKTMAQRHPAIQPAPVSAPLVRRFTPMVIPLILALVGSMSACGGGTKTTATSSGTPASSPAPSSSAPTVVNTDADQSTARTLMLAASDLPAGWKTTKAPGSDVTFLQLTGITPTHAYTVKPASKLFEKGNLSVESSAAIARPGENFAADATVLADTRFSQKLKGTMRDTFKQGNPNASFESVELTPLSVTKHGQYSVAYRSLTKFKTQGFGIALYDDLVWLASGRMEITLSFASVDVPFNAKLQKALIGKVAVRLEAAAGQAA